MKPISFIKKLQDKIALKVSKQKALEVEKQQKLTQEWNDKKQPIIMVKNLFQFYGISRTPTLNDISCSIPKGCFCALLGQNGSGKSTFIKSLLNINVHTKGDIIINGNLLSTKKPNQTVINFIPDKDLFPMTTVYQFLKDMALFSGIPHTTAQTKIEQLLKKHNLWDFRFKNPNKLSGGQRKKVMILQACLNKPDVLIADEPFNFLSPQIRVECFNILKELNEAGTTIILSTHILAEIESKCNYILLIDKGKVIFEGSKQTFIYKNAKYLNTKISSTNQEELTKNLSEHSVPFTLNQNNEIIITDPTITLEKLNEILQKSSTKITEFIIQKQSMEDIFMKLIS